jgi:hypothetical protein
MRKPDQAISQLTLDRLSVPPGLPVSSLTIPR